MDMNVKAEDFDRGDSAAQTSQTASASPEPTTASEQGPNTGETSPESTKKEPITREKSQIAFPWYDLDVAIGVARVMHDGGGIGVSREQLAGMLNIAPGSGNFSIKTGAARMYGLIEANQSKYQLTQLGFSILSKDDATEKTARVEAFLNVPLYRRAYDEFKGKPLPPRPTGLENAFGEFGVPSKSRAVARQVFERAARQSGFSNVDPDRLIEPVIGSSAPSESQHAKAPDIATSPPVTQIDAHGAKHQDSLSIELDELLRGLLRRLPKEGQKWTPEAKAKWLRALSQNLDYVCEVEGDSEVVVEVRHS